MLLVLIKVRFGSVGSVMVTGQPLFLWRRHCWLFSFKGNSILAVLFIFFLSWNIDTFLHSHSPLTALQYIEVIRKYSLSMIPDLDFIAILGTATLSIYKKTMGRTNQRRLLLCKALFLLVYIFYLLSLLHIYLYHKKNTLYSS
ncbi:hypothetical protein FIV31_03075 [Coxiella endosymbiont of Ornithodoros amblus]|uniref:hypothetical protein n=1 Tax=Coxiella endosymbiont of Ornithodoros amblus TaxID=1656166 RepID=UPI00244E4558|nr:hypothetical protein [Coxiella endosymbiont of Ornithodoros amblus]MBW5802596.1 hypothetical protein [Coxiella endosymbiont of Ornithodoros amblus]